MKTEWVFQGESEMAEMIIALLSEYGKRATLVLALVGDLGAGKTTFTQQLGKQLGVTDSITSPTFTIMSSYETGGDTFSHLVHIDAYRIDDESEIGPLRLREILEQPSSVVCIEWPEKVASIIPADAIRLEFTILPDESRRVTIV